MFTANIKNKIVNPNGSLKVEVEFTDGGKTFTDTVIPQDGDGLTHFITGRLKELDFGKGENLPIGEFVPPADVTPVVDPEVKARIAWLAKVSRYARIKSLLVDTGVLTSSESDLDTLKADIKKDFSVDFLTYI